jgi:hypothetical protein
VGLEYTNTNGYVRIGPNNTSWCHFYTDRGQYYFNEQIHVHGNIESYATSGRFGWRTDEDTYMFRQGTNHIGFMAGNNEGLVITDNGVHINKDADYGSTSGLYIGETFNNVGNHEVLRANRGGGGGFSTSEVGYYSSFEFDPETGERRKTDIQEIDLDQIDLSKVRPVVYRRTDTKQAQERGGVGAPEMGFVLEDLVAANPILTTKPGSQVGYSPDELALLALLWKRVEQLEDRLTMVEERCTC